MNKMTKLGVTALCGSLAAVSSANAGDMTVTGGVHMTWTTFDGPSTGNPIGINSNLTFKGSGELDNGWNVALTTALTEAAAYSNTNVVVTVPAFGDIRIDAGTSGTGIDRIDDVTPNVWEEAYGTGLGTAIKTVGGSSAGSTIELTPNMLPEGMTARFAWSPDAAGADAAELGTSGTAASSTGSGYDVTLQLTDAITGMSGLTIDAGMSKVSQDATTSGIDGDKEEQTVAVKYAIGGFTLGYQWSEQDLGTDTAALQYDNAGYGITFAVNDDLSIGYNHYESDQDNATDVTAEATSLQIAYTMGGVTIRAAQASVDNAAYQTAAMYDQDATTLSVALAF